MHTDHLNHEVSCYSQRMLNPFRGIFCAIRYQSAEAITADGVHWDIYVNNDALREGLGDDVVVQTSDIRYGKWSMESGLRRGPMYPSEDFRRLEAMGEVVYQHLLDKHDQVPFPFLDNIELWLFDQSGAPLALLESVTQTSEISATAAGHWQCGTLCREEFISGSLRSSNETDMPAGEWLMQQVERLAGPERRMQWVVRCEDGSGKLLNDKQVIPAETFPLFTLREPGDQSLVAAVIKEYFSWLAPWLLQLDHLDEGQRCRLEKSAAQQALILNKLYHLYPAVVDESVLKAARVEAALRQSVQHEPGQQGPDNRQATYYIEPDEHPFQ